MRSLILAGALGVVLAAGVVIGHELTAVRNAIFPQAKAEHAEKVWPLASDVHFDVQSAIHVHSNADADRVRSELIRRIFKNDTLPDVMATLGDEADLSQTGVDFAAPGAKWLTYEMRYGFKSKMLYLPHLDPKCLFIFGDGHAEQVLSHHPITYPVLESVFDFGCDELIISMPMRGHNPRPIVTVPGKGTMDFSAGRHDDLSLLQSREFHPLSLFLEPVLAGINYLTRLHDYEFVSMSGISGGGWATTMYAALDPRIQLSAVVADSAPMYLRLMDKRSMGDWEQIAPDIYSLASYLDLYVMDTSGGRLHTQIINVDDDCCFGGTGAKTYSDKVAAAAQALGGTFSLYLDRTATQHEITPWASDIIVHSVVNHD